jgi:hypothetical protein
VQAVADVDVGIGLPCPDGLPDCGRLGVDQYYCAQLDLGDAGETALCSADCSGNADCQAYGDFVCVQGYCTVDCDDCASSQVCMNDPNTNQTGCF